MSNYRAITFGENIFEQITGYTISPDRESLPGGAIFRRFILIYRPGIQDLRLCFSCSQSEQVGDTSRPRVAKSDIASLKPFLFATFLEYFFGHSVPV